MSLTYRDAGVDIDAGNAFVQRIGPLAKATFRPGVLDSLGGFGGLFGLKEAGYRDPILVSGTDGVGTKLKLAFQTGSHETVGIDLVAMCVNDVLTCGASPLFFLDYLGIGKLELGVAERIVEGIANGCKQAGCALLGGETAELPGMYAAGEYDLAGFCVAAVERDEIIDMARVQQGDLLLGLRSSGLHSNGYSLARKALLDVRGLDLGGPSPVADKNLGQCLLTPTRIYVEPILKLLSSAREAIHGMAHITGGGLTENVPRVLPEGLVPEINYEAWDTPEIFAWIAAAGISEEEMRRTFNLGIGFVLVIGPDRLDQVQSLLEAMGEPSVLLGQVAQGAV